ncbi:hypothetical protein [Chitinilyticum litopenaei]|uniref:hypothetical protein n=1 Tax=Chitinilyticum litopenaei TaxID=1121276 RepID=UPI000410B917|nr:hypothetical protein [Chitinilyticum litopenaei]
MSRIKPRFVPGVTGGARLDDDLQHLPPLDEEAVEAFRQADLQRHSESYCEEDPQPGWFHYECLQARELSLLLQKLCVPGLGRLVPQSWVVQLPELASPGTEWVIAESIQDAGFAALVLSEDEALWPVVLPVGHIPVLTSGNPTTLSALISRYRPPLVLWCSPLHLPDDDFRVRGIQLPASYLQHRRLEHDWQMLVPEAAPLSVADEEMLLQQPEPVRHWVMQQQAWFLNQQVAAPELTQLLTLPYGVRWQETAAFRQPSAADWDARWRSLLAGGEFPMRVESDQAASGGLMIDWCTEWPLPARNVRFAARWQRCGQQLALELDSVCRWPATLAVALVVACNQANGGEWPMTCWVTADGVQVQVHARLPLVATGPQSSVAMDALLHRVTQRLHDWCHTLPADKESLQ